MTDEDYELDDEFEYHAYTVGRAKNTVEVKAPDGSLTIEKGTIHFELTHEENLRDRRMDGGWTGHYVAPEGGVGFGIGEGNSGGAVVRYDLIDVIELPEPMTEKEADEWVTDEKLLSYRDETIESDLTAEDLLEAIR